MKKVVETKQKTSYTRISKNIYKVGKSYRVRVNGASEYLSTRKEAFNRRKILLTGTVLNGI